MGSERGRTPTSTFRCRSAARCRTRSRRPPWRVACSTSTTTSSWPNDGRKAGVVRATKIQALVIAAVGALAACKKGNTYVQVQIVPAANEPAGIITKIELQMTLAGKNETKSFSEPGDAPITLPTNFTLQVGSGSGQMAITAICFNAQGAEVDRGATTADVATGGIT